MQVHDNLVDIARALAVAAAAVVRVRLAGAGAVEYHARRLGGRGVDHCGWGGIMENYFDLVCW